MEYNSFEIGDLIEVTKYDNPFFSNVIGKYGYIIYISTSFFSKERIYECYFPFFDGGTALWMEEEQMCLKRQAPRDGDIIHLKNGSKVELKNSKIILNTHNYIFRGFKVYNKKQNYDFHDIQAVIRKKHKGPFTATQIEKWI